MSPEITVCDCPCKGCMFYSVCWSYLDFEIGVICSDYNFCSKNFIVGFTDLNTNECLTLKVF